MPITINLTDSDISKSKLLKSGWFTGKVKSVSQQPSKDGDSTTYPVTILCTGPIDEAAGAELTVYFSEKAPGMMVPFLAAAFGKEVKDIKAGNYNLSAAEGKNIEFYNKPDEYQGRPKNSIVDWRPAKGGAASTAAPAGPIG